MVFFYFSRILEVFPESPEQVEVAWEDMNSDFTLGVAYYG